MELKINQISFFLVLVFPLFSSCHKELTNTDITKPNIESIKIPDSTLITLSTTYFIQSHGSSKSSLSKSGIFHDEKRLNEIHKEVNKILSQAGIKLLNAEDTSQTRACALPNNLPPDIHLKYKVGNIDPVRSIRSYRDKLNTLDKIIEGFFLSKTIYAKQFEKPDTIFEMDNSKYKAEVYIHLVSSLQQTSNFRNFSKFLGMYVPYTWRTYYTDQKLARIESMDFPKNLTEYLIIIGDEDIKDDHLIATVIAHELCHAFGITKHSAIKKNLMYRNKKNIGNNLTPSQIKRIRKGAYYFKHFGIVNMELFDFKINA